MSLLKSESTPPAWSIINSVEKVWCIVAYIYVITNKINGKQYVGKTTDTINKRWITHLKDYDKPRYEKRPLYDAMNKYGIQNFIIEELEQCSIEILSKREQYWINYLNTFYNGYNATLGGDGKLLYNYEELANKYLELGTVKETAKFFNCDIETIRKACREYNIKIKTRPQQIKDNSLSVKRLDKQRNILNIFKNTNEAADFIIKNQYTTSKNKTSIISHINEVCRGERKSAYGFIWLK